MNIIIDAVLKLTKKLMLIRKSRLKKFTICSKTPLKKLTALGIMTAMTA